MKKILITANNLSIGGIETSLINYLKTLSTMDYKIDLILEKKEGIFLSEVPSNINVYDYNIARDKNVLVRKIKNFINITKWKKKLKNKYDISISFATYSKVGAILALCASNNSILWIHGNYYESFKKDVNKLKSFFNMIQFDNFKKYIFVSKENYESIKNNYKKIDNYHIINNLIDGEAILEKSKEAIQESKLNKPLFINVGRHEEHQKRLSLIIDAVKKLKDEKYDFELWLIGVGEDTEKYKDKVDKLDLNDYIKFMGSKKNPYPYFKLADAIILSSLYEGYPVVFNEAKLLKIPIITTKVSDYKDIDDKYGIVCDDIYEGMKSFLENKFTIKEKFDYKKYNAKIKEELGCVLNEE